MKTEKPIRQIEYSEKTVVGLNYFGSGAYAVVGEKFLGIVSFKKTFEYDYKNKYLICYRVSKRSGVLLALSDSESGNNSELIWLDSAGHEKANFKTKYCIKDVTFENNKIIALSLDKILKFTKSFKVIKEKEIPTNLIRVEHIGGKIYGVGQNKIVKLF